MKTTHKKSSSKWKPVNEGFITVAGAGVLLVLGLSLMAVSTVQL